MSEQADAPVLRVVRGDPTAEELAALVAVLAASGSAAASAAATAARPRPEWRNRARGMRALPATGPGAWRASGLPR